MKRVCALNLICLLICILIPSGCEKTPYPHRDNEDYDMVMVMFSLGNNNLADNLAKNISTVEQSPLPLYNSDKVLLIYEHLKGVKDLPALIRLSSGWSGEIIRDTLCTWPSGTLSTSSKTISEVLGYVSENFRSEHYGLLFSSHGTGWLPEGYYISPQSFGSEKSRSKTVEMSIRDLASAIPSDTSDFHTDFIILDACLMGGVETAYELKDKAGLIAFSAAEIIEDGMDYSVLTRRLLKTETRSVEEFCKAYYEHYLALDGWYRSATVSCVSTAGLKGLADVCRDLFDKYREAIDSLDGKDVQGFFSENRHWFYDLEDILVKAGITDSDKSRLEDALGKCVTYKATTDTLLSTIPVNTFCGLSMYLPSEGSDFLNGFYKSLSWNNDTDLVK